jgi:hypothetical protein
VEISGATQPPNASAASLNAPPPMDLPELSVVELLCRLDRAKRKAQRVVEGE